MDGLRKILFSRSANLFFMLFFLIEVLTAIFRALLNEPHSGSNLVVHIFVAAFATFFITRRPAVSTRTVVEEHEPSTD